MRPLVVDPQRRGQSEQGLNSSDVSFRGATVADAPLLTAWDRAPHVIRCTTDDPRATVARDAGDWEGELASPTPDWEHLIAEVQGRPVGAMLIIDPALEPTHYWGEIESDLRAIDIWIGPQDALGRGHGTAMMTQAIERCFALAEIKAIVIDPLASNVAAHRFYRRLGFVPVGPRRFGEDDCLVHRLDRAAWASLSAAASAQASRAQAR
jgi:aminoglycoside 6'-N-acetyltransferase